MKNGIIKLGNKRGFFMKTKKDIENLTKISISLLVLTGILSFFKIGPNTEPLYMYISVKKMSFMAGVFLLSASSIMGCYLFFSILNNKLDSFYKNGVILLLITLMSNFLLGGNLLFIIGCIFNIIILVLNMKICSRDC